jgi:prepilin-type N-terminal cleavage/methylation domain-containing protein
MFNIAKKTIKVKRQLSGQLEKKSQEGVTLIEILIVVTILLLLMLALYRTIGREVTKSRDANRKKDLKQIKIAFENYYNDNNCYPPDDILENCGGGELSPYLQEIPCDPLGFPYLYLPISDVFANNNCGGYRVLTRIGIIDDPDIEAVGCPGGCGVPEGILSPEGYNYGIAEGIALNQVPGIPQTIDPSLCTEDDHCYCCPGPGNQCNSFWPAGGGFCHVGGPYRTLNDCYNATECTPFH